MLLCKLNISTATRVFTFRTLDNGSGIDKQLVFSGERSLGRVLAFASQRLLFDGSH